MKFYRPSELLILFVWPSFSHSHIWQLVAWSFDIALLGGRGSFFKFREGRAFDTHRYRFSAFLVRESQHHPQDLRYKRSNRGNSRYYISVSIHSRSISTKRKISTKYADSRKYSRTCKRFSQMFYPCYTKYFEIPLVCNEYFIIFFNLNEFRFYQYQSCLITALMNFESVLRNRYNVDIKVF